tara:strand:- start:7714 stop:10092 length:2379 start_codon:yes stop_codon:yes gene_type:complete
MKNKLKKFFIIFLFIINTEAFSNELEFEAGSIEFIDKDKVTLAKNGVKITSGKDFTINANSMRYDKESEYLQASGDVLTTDHQNEVEIKSDKIIYNKKINEITSQGNVLFNFKKSLFLETDKITFLRNQRKIMIDNKSTIKDNFGNSVEMTKSIIELNEKLIKVKDVILIDSQKNKYMFANAFIDFEKNEFIGDGIKIDFFKGSFGNSDNDPRLRGNYVYGNEKTTLIKKGVFTTCKKNKDCPPWQLKAEEIEHNKKKKTIYYKNAWLEIYDKPVFYFPKFFHPDPTVKRQSGFLMPQIEDSSSLGLSFSIPYYKVISDDRDFTFTPRIFSENEALFQNEYRQVTKNSKHITDLSLKTKDGNSKSHFFSNTTKDLNFEYFNQSEIEFNVETTSSDNYLKTHKIKTGITNSQSLLNSFLKFTGTKKDLDLEIKFQSFEDLTKEKDSDKFEYLFPSYELSKNFKTNFNGELSLYSNGYYKNYQTNIFEKVFINDIKYETVPKISKLGFVNKLNLLLKNVSSEGENSRTYKNNFDSENFGSLMYDLSYPMQKKGVNFDSFLTGKSIFMFSPNSNQDNKDADRQINIDNIFSQNRLSLSNSVEGGQSVTIGAEYNLKSKSTNRDVISSSLATVIRDQNENNLPSSSTINNKSSDLIGSLILKPNNNFKIDYDFSIDNDFESTNYNSLKTDISVNKFVTSFEFLQEDDEVGNESYLSNVSSYNFNNNHALKYRTRRNRKTDLTEFYNLIYEYKNDCLKAAIQYNKEYYSDGEIKPNEEIFFSISIVPFTTINSPSAR